MMFNNCNHNHQCQTLTRRHSKSADTAAPSPSNSTSSSRLRRERHSLDSTTAVRNAARRRPAAVPVKRVLSQLDEAPVPPTIPENLRVRVPERLVRPPSKGLDEEALAACGPDVADVPLGYIRDRLKEVGPQMLAAARGQNLAAATMPLSLEVEDDQSLPFAPTHMLAVYSPRDWKAGGRRAVRYVPVHDVVLAVHCTNLPALSPRDDSPSSIAVTSLCLPNTSTFDIVLDYLYTQNLNTLLSSLLPRTAKGIPAEKIPATIAKGCSTAELTQRLFRTHALWMNVCALGVQDDALWNMLAVVWRVLLSALRMGGEAGSPVNVVPVV